MTAKTLFEKVWETHVVVPGDPALLFADMHLVHEVTSPQAFSSLAQAGRKVRRPDLTFATVDHGIPTTGRHLGILDPMSKRQVEALRDNCARHGIPMYGIDDPRQGIVHVVGPEQGLTQPGMLIVCGDSHTSTHGAFGALAFGIGTSEVEHVLATQTLWQSTPLSMAVEVSGAIPLGVAAKDLILGIIAQIGVAGGTRHVVEYRGEAIRALSMEQRMTICNMSIEGGARAGMIAPDDTTLTFIEGRPFAPTGQKWNEAVDEWSSLVTDPDAVFDKVVEIDASALVPHVSWGVNPAQTTTVDGHVPSPDSFDDPLQRDATARALEYMGLEPGTAIREITIDHVFLGSCTNGRIEDLRAAAGVVEGRKVASTVSAVVVPGSMQVKAEAEAEGLDAVFLAAGFEWRDAGCSSCLAMNPDVIPSGERVASTSNRNYEGRQGRGARTHLVSPAMAAAAAVAGHFVDVRDWGKAMKPVRVVRGSMVPLDRADVDTDQIIPQQFLKRIERDGYGEFLFYNWAHHDDGSEIKDFITNRPEREGARVLVAGSNFGCGSSREHAPWAIQDWGFDAVIAPSTADIFRNNSANIGLLIVELPDAEVRQLMEMAQDPDATVTIDLEQQTVTGDGFETGFDFDPSVKDRLLHGLDRIGTTLIHEDEITRHEMERPGWLPTTTGSQSV